MCVFTRVGVCDCDCARGRDCGFLRVPLKTHLALCVSLWPSAEASNSKYQSLYTTPWLDSQQKKKDPCELQEPYENCDPQEL